MELALKYISLITACSTGIAFVIGLFKWIDQRARDQEQRIYEGKSWDTHLAPALTTHSPSTFLKLSKKAGTPTQSQL